MRGCIHHLRYASKHTADNVIGDSAVAGLSRRVHPVPDASLVLAPGGLVDAELSAPMDCLWWLRHDRTPTYGQGAPVPDTERESRGVRDVQEKTFEQYKETGVIRSRDAPRRLPLRQETLRGRGRRRSTLYAVR